MRFYPELLRLDATESVDAVRAVRECGLLIAQPLVINDVSTSTMIRAYVEKAIKPIKSRSEPIEINMSQARR